MSSSDIEDADIELMEHIDSSDIGDTELEQSAAALSLLEILQHCEQFVT